MHRCLMEEGSFLHFVVQTEKSTHETLLQRRAPSRSATATLWANGVPLTHVGICAEVPQERVILKK